MTARPRVAVAATLATVVAAGCATAPPDYQSVWSTPSTTTSATPPTPEAAQLNIAGFLEESGVVGEPVAPDMLTDLTVSIPTPPDWVPYRGTNPGPGTRMIVQGDTYPTAMLMAFQLVGDFDPREAVTHGNVDAENSENFRELNSSATDFNGFPSSMIEGSYDLNGQRMHTYNRIVIATGAPPANQRYLVQFTVTGYSEAAADEAPDIEAIIRGFTVEVP